jgi:ribonuclease P protein component
MAGKRFGFGRKEKLKSRKQIEELFLNGKSFSVFPLRVTYQFTCSEIPAVQVGVTAGKKYFKRAVDRNRMKRLMREAYRLQKGHFMELLKEKQQSALLFFMYTGKELTTFVPVKEAMAKCLERLQKLAQPNEANS